MYKIFVIGTGLCLGAASTFAGLATQDFDVGQNQSRPAGLTTASPPLLPPQAPGGQARGLPGRFPNQGQQNQARSNFGAGGGVALVGRSRNSHRDFVNKIQKAESDDDREKAIKEAREHLETEYDRYVDSTEKQIEALQKRLETLQDHLEKRKDAKERLVDLKLELLISEADGIGWPSNSRPLGFPGATGMSSEGNIFWARPTDAENEFFEKAGNLRVTRPARPAPPAKPRRSGER